MAKIHYTFALNVKISRVTSNPALEWRYNTFRPISTFTQYRRLTTTIITLF